MVLAAAGSLGAEGGADAGPRVPGHGVAPLSAASSCWGPLRLPRSARRGRLTEIFRDRGTTWILGIASPSRGGRPIALRRATGGWRETSVPWRGVSGLMAGDSEPGVGTWAVGFVRPGVSMRPISGRWRGGRWVAVGVPDPPGPGAALADVEVLPSGRVWAVGSRLQSGRTRAFALRWAGRWRRDDPPGGDESALAAVAEGPGGTAWAGGWRLVGGVPRPYLLRRSAAGWERSPTRRVPAGQAVIIDIAFGSGGEGYAAGYLVPADETSHVPLLLRWDGSAWEPLDLPWAGRASAILHSVTPGPGDSLLLTGARVAGNNAWTRAFHARRGGGRWEVRRAEVNPYHNSELLDGAYLARRPLVVGGHAGRTMAFRGCPELTATRASEAAIDERSGRDARRPRGTVRDGARAGSRSSRRAAATGSVRFVDVARRTGLYEVGPTWGGVSADFDADGWPDVFYSRHNAVKPRLLLGGRDGFRRPPRSPYRDRDRHGCAAADVDADGRPDLFCTHGANRGTNMTSNELWLRPGTRDLRQVTADYGLVDPFGRGRAATFLDLDGDPYPDLYVTNEPERVDGIPSLNRLYRNDAGRRFVAVPELGLDRSMGGICTTSGDVDSDGDDDLLVCTSESWRGPAGLRVFRNEDGTLREATRGLGLRPIGDQDVVLADLDGDGRADDLAQLGPGRLRVSIGSPSGFRSVFEMAVSSGVALGAGDADGDGRADLYVVRGGAGNQPDLLLLNRRKGRAFRRASIPQARSGTADDVIVLDHDRNGLDDFLVLNGRGFVGPVQLIAAFRRR